MTLLIGSATPGNPAHYSLCPDGYEQSLKFTAAESGTIDTLRLTTSAAGPATNTCTSVKFGVRDDDAGYPGTLVGSGTATGTPGMSTDVDVTGLSIDVVVGQAYWLCLLPLGGDIYLDMTTSGGGGTDDIFTGGGLLTSFPTTPDPGELSNEDGPAAFQGLGDVAAPTPITGLVWQVTGLWYPDADSVDEYGTIADPDGGEVVIPLNDSRTAKVTLSVNDKLAASVVGHAYARALKCYYHGTLIFWGIISLPEVDMDAGTVTLNAVDPSIRAIRHYLRRGDLDGDLSAPNDRANVTIDHLGLRLVLDAARNIPGQTARGCPDIGINVGTNDFVADPTSLMGVSRGDPVWDTDLQLSQTLGPDFELEPLDNTVGAYCKLNTYIRQGTDKSATVQLHYGTGLDNLENLAFTEGSQYVTHVHVLSRDHAYRFTRVNVEASAETGQYTIWDATDYDSHGIAAADVEAVLEAYGDDILKAYGRPLIAVTLTMPVETDGSWRYLTDYAVGDTIGVAGRAGYVELPASDYRITKVTLTQAGEANGVQPSVEVVADRAADDTITGDE